MADCAADHALNGLGHALAGDVLVLEFNAEGQDEKRLASPGRQGDERPRRKRCATVNRIRYGRILRSAQ